MGTLIYRIIENGLKTPLGYHPHQNGLVLGGNGRTMTLLMVVSDFPASYDEYYNKLISDCNYYGIAAESVKSIAFPVLVRVVNTDKNKSCEYYSRIFNESMKQTIDTMDKAIGYIKALGKSEVQKIASNISQSLETAERKGTKLTTFRQVITNGEILPDFIDMMERAKIINNTNRNTYIDENGYLKTESDLIIEYMFYAMVFDNRTIIDYIRENGLLNIERVLGLLLNIKSLDGQFNILPQLTVAVEKMKTGRSASSEKLDIDKLYRQKNIVDDLNVRYIEYLWMTFLGLKKDAQKEVLQNYLRLVSNLTTGMWAPEGDADVSPEKLFEMAFDDAKVKIKLSNLGDKKSKKRKSDFPCTIKFARSNAVVGKENRVVIECKIGTNVGYSHIASSKYNATFDTKLFAVALKKCLMKNGLIADKKSLYSSDLDWLLNEIDGLHGTDFSSADFENVGNDTILLRSLNCGSAYKKELEGSYYIPAMFDKPKKRKNKLSDSKPQTLSEKIVAWFKNDWNKKYRWQ
jgi:hypothetical protein